MRVQGAKSAGSVGVLGATSPEISRMREATLGNFEGAFFAASARMESAFVSVAPIFLLQSGACEMEISLERKQTSNYYLPAVFNDRPRYQKP